MKKLFLFILITLIIVFTLNMNIFAKTSITIGASSDAVRTAAWMIRSPQEKLYWSATYELLYVLDEDGNVVPNLAAKDLVADSKNLTYTVTLRDDVYFSDGSHLDADVLLWNFENFKENSIVSATHFGDVDYFEKLDDYTVVIHMKEWNSQIPYSLTSVPGLMYSKKAFDEHGYDWCLKWPVGTGPFVLDEWIVDEYKVFLRNENYWRKNVDIPIDRLVFRVIADQMSAQAALLAGEIDGYFGPSEAMKHQMLQQGFKINNGKMWQRIVFLIFGSAIEGSPLSDVRVRQAISYAIDSEEIAETIDYGLSIPSNQYAVKGTPFYNENVKGYPYNPEKARELLAEAGYENGFSTVIMTGADMPFDDYLIAIQGYCADIGIDVEIDKQEKALWTSKTLYGTDVKEGMILVGHGFGINLVNQQASNFSKRAVLGVGMMKDAKLHPDDLDEVIMLALRTTDFDEMLRLQKKAQELIIDKYCLGYPVVINPAYSLVLNPRVNPGRAWENNDEFFHYTELSVVE